MGAANDTTLSFAISPEIRFLKDHTTFRDFLTPAPKLDPSLVLGVRLRYGRVLTPFGEEGGALQGPWVLRGSRLAAPPLQRAITWDLVK